MKKINWNVLCFYGLSVLFLLFGSYMMFQVYHMLKEYVGVMSFNEMIQYYLSNCASYFAYAILFYGIASILKGLTASKEATVEEMQIEEEKTI